jgi:hypothetical protein
MELAPEAHPPAPIGGILSLVGGAIALVGLFLPWVTLDLGDFAGLAGLDLDPISVNGFEATAGLPRLILIVGVIPLAVLALILRTRGGRMSMGASLIAAGGVLVVLDVIVLIEALDYSPGFGLWITLAGSAMVTVGGGFALSEAPDLPRSQHMPVGAAPPPPPD